MVKFLIYPVAGLMLGTTHPLVAVVSSSMQHNVNYDEWWEKNKGFYENLNITKPDFSKFTMPNGFEKGDIILLVGKDYYDLGDIIVFRSSIVKPRNDPIIHRIIEKWEDNGEIYYKTKGDNNYGILNNCDSAGCIDETKISENMLLGKALIRIPLLGWVKIIFVDFIQNILGGLLGK